MEENSPPFRLASIQWTFITFWAIVLTVAQIYHYRFWSAPIAAVLIEWGIGILLAVLGGVLLNQTLLKRWQQAKDELIQSERSENQARLSQSAEQLHGAQEQIQQARRVETELLERENQLLLLAEIADTAFSTTDLSVLLQTFVEKVGAHLRADSCSLALWDEDAEALVPAAVYDPYRLGNKTSRYEAAEASLSVQILQADELVAVEDASQSAFALSWSAGLFSVQSLIGAPVRAENEKIGTLLVLFGRKQSFSDTARQFIERAAQQAGLAIAQTRAVSEIHKRLRQAETLRRAGEAVAETLNQREAVERILEHLGQVIEHDFATIHLLQNEALEVVGEHGWLDPAGVIGLRLPITGDSPAVRAIQNRQPVVLRDASSAHPLFQQPPFDRVNSWVGVPLLVHDQLVGLLSIASRRKGFYTNEHARLAERFAQEVAIALENARLYTVERLRVRELNALHSATAALLNTLNLEELLGKILDAAISAIPTAEKGLLHLVVRDTGQLQVRAVHGYSDPRIRKFVSRQDQWYVAKAVRERRPMLIRDAQQEPEFHYEGEFPETFAIRSAIVAPLILRSEVLGTLSLESTRPNGFVEANLQLLVSFGTTATEAIRNAMLYAEVQEYAITDALTSLYNRRGLFELGEREVERAQRFKRPLSVIWIDADHFKEVNDTYGHQIGDQVLRALSERFRAGSRRMDILGRYGGDEFVILLLESDLLTAQEVAERLRLSVVSKPFKTEAGEVQVTISLGVTQLTTEVSDLSSLLEAADHAMYEAKKAGRNQVVVRS